jgi:hypothetical protein
LPRNETQVSLVMSEGPLTEVLVGPRSLAPGLHIDPRAMGFPVGRAGAICPPVRWGARGVGLYV